MPQDASAKVVSGGARNRAIGAVCASFFSNPSAGPAHLFPPVQLPTFSEATQSQRAAQLTARKLWGSKVYPLKRGRWRRFQRNFEYFCPSCNPHYKFVAARSAK